MLSIFTDLGMKQILLAQCYNLQNKCLQQFRIHILISFPATGLFLYSTLPPVYLHIYDILRVGHPAEA